MNEPNTKFFDLLSGKYSVKDIQKYHQQEPPNVNFEIRCAKWQMNTLKTIFEDEKRTVVYKKK